MFAGLQEKQSDSHAHLSYAARLIASDAAQRTRKGKGIRVAVVDTGVDTDHPELRGRIAKTQNFVDGGERDFARDRHGTAVVGVIAARADDGSGFSGIAPETEVIAVKACWYPERADGKASCSSWTLAKAIDFSINTDARVLNLSLAGPPDPLLARLIARAHKQGMTIVAASAESGDGHGFPASLQSVIVVVATDAGGRIAQRLSSGSKPAIAAPRSRHPHDRSARGLRSRLWKLVRRRARHRCSRLAPRTEPRVDAGRRVGAAEGHGPPDTRRSAQPSRRGRRRLCGARQTAAKIELPGTYPNEALDRPARS